MEPPVFTSKKGVLDILMVAKAKPVAAISFKAPGIGGPINPDRLGLRDLLPSQAINDSCPDGKSTTSDFGGVRLALQPGDTLKIRLVNKLPKQDPGKVRHYWNSDDATPTVDPRMASTCRSPPPTSTPMAWWCRPAARPSTTRPGATTSTSTLYNPANGMPQDQMMDHGAVVTSGVLDYVIKIPPNEPSGADWFHPHVHGITSDSLSSGLSGIISIGDHTRYLSDGIKPFPRTRCAT